MPTKLQCEESAVTTKPCRKGASRFRTVVAGIVLVPSLVAGLSVLTAAPASAYSKTCASEYRSIAPFAQQWKEHTNRRGVKLCLTQVKGYKFSQERVADDPERWQGKKTVVYKTVAYRYPS